MPWPQMEPVPNQKDRLSDPEYAAWAWARFRRVMRGMLCVAIIAILATLGYLRWADVPMPWPVILATAGGVGFTVMLGGALMSLAFLSAGTGHDEDVINFLEDE